MTWLMLSNMGDGAIGVLGMGLIRGASCRFMNGLALVVRMLVEKKRCDRGQPQYWCLFLVSNLVPEHRSTENMLRVGITPYLVCS